MNATLKNAWGYQGDATNLPVASVDLSLPFYERVLGFNVEATGSTPDRSAVLERNGIRMRIVENGGDPTQDGCAFEVDNVEALFEEFRAKDWPPSSKLSDALKIEVRNDGTSWKVFYVIAPDGLCFWFGEKQ